MDDLSKPNIVLLGLGPGDENLLTRQAWQWLQQIDEVFICSRDKIIRDVFPKKLRIIELNQIQVHSVSRSNIFKEEKYLDQIVQQIIELGKKQSGVTYAVPGHPIIDNKVCNEIIKYANTNDLAVRVIDGVSFLDCICKALGISPLQKSNIIDAQELIQTQIPLFSPSVPSLIMNIYSNEIALDVKERLLHIYPKNHQIQLVHNAGTNRQLVEQVMINEMDRSMTFDEKSAIYMLPLEQGASFEEFQELIAHLRAPQGCPWDRKQTHQTLRTYLLEETYETLTAIDTNDMESLKEELGDLLLQIVLHIQVATENETFQMAGVLQHIYNKLVRRHPHVFAEVKVDDVGGVLRNWEDIKADERKMNNHEEKGFLDGVPVFLPALSQAQEVQERASRIGFDWAEIDPVWKKVYEELDEVRTSIDESSREAEIGDLFFAVVNLARWYKIDAESALRVMVKRFRQRFNYIEKTAKEQGRLLSDMTLEEMDKYWEEAKKL